MTIRFIRPVALALALATAGALSGCGGKPASGDAAPGNAAPAGSTALEPAQAAMAAADSGNSKESADSADSTTESKDAPATDASERAPEPKTEANPQPSPKPEPKLELAGSDVSDEGIGGSFLIPSTLGKDVDITQPGDAVSAFVVGYTSCPDVCPTNMLRYKEAARLLKERGKDFRLYFLTMDPERDTMERMKSYMKLYSPKGLPPFVGLREGDLGKLEEIKSAWKVFARKVPHKSTYLVDHSAGAYLIGPDGKTRVYQPHNLNARELADDILNLLEQYDREKGRAGQNGENSGPSPEGRGPAEDRQGGEG